MQNLDIKDICRAPAYFILPMIAAVVALAIFTILGCIVVFLLIHFIPAENLKKLIAFLLVGITATITISHDIRNLTPRRSR